MSDLKHIAIIMDGNGRYAKRLGRDRSYGHKKGAANIRDITRYCVEHESITHLTLYAFSTENWNRPKYEVSSLMKLLKSYLKSERKTYMDNDIAFGVIGDLSAFNEPLRSEIEELAELTKDNKALKQTLALNYGSHDEIARAYKASLLGLLCGDLGGLEVERKIDSTAREGLGVESKIDSTLCGGSGNFNIERKIDSTLCSSLGVERKVHSTIKPLLDALASTPHERLGSLLESALDTRGLPPLDMLIRTGGEYRLSNFLLYQVAYSELFFTKTLWPDFTKEELASHIEDFYGRTRRFGGV